MVPADAAKAAWKSGKPSSGPVSSPGFRLPGWGQDPLLSWGQDRLLETTSSVLASVGDAAGTTHGKVLIGVLADPSLRLLAQDVS